MFGWQEKCLTSQKCIINNNKQTRLTCGQPF